jgi:hypothetical protein
MFDALFVLALFVPPAVLVVAVAALALSKPRPTSAPNRREDVRTAA